MSSATNLDDAAFAARFEALELAPTDFGHQAHIRVAFSMLERDELGAAAVRFRRALQRFAAHHGATAKYHETITWAYLAIIHRRMAEAPYASADDFLDRNADLGDPSRALGRYYDVAQLVASPLARRVFVLPEPR